MNPGTRLGPYVLGQQIGAGGMGEVYHATDTRLDRSVAIKVLPEHLATDPQRRERFEREAKAVSSLNHPHICTLHDVGEQDGTHFLVMELVEGQTLEQRLQRGRLPLDQVLEYAIQIADALDKAHRQGVVHRDLKPGNIMLTKSGVKLLDFGLAKLKGDQATVSPMSQMPTHGTAPLTAEGTILGTLQYMAPEQLEGKEADARTDIFAFGVVVYEMVTGKKAFEGESQAGLIGAIMHSEPPVARLQAVAPPALEHLVKTCLVKDADRRWQSAGDVGRNLRWIGEAGASSASATLVPQPSASPVWRQPVPVALSLAVALGVTAVVLAVRNPVPVETTARQVRFELSVPDGLSMGYWQESPLALSPDGTSVAYLAPDGIMVRALDAFEARLVPNTRDATTPMFSPDGNRIAFLQPPYLKHVPVEGGPAVTVAEIGAIGGVGSSWSPNGGFLLTGIGTNGISWLPEDGGDPTQITHVLAEEGENVHAWPIGLPDTTAILYTALGPGGGWADGKTILFDPNTSERRVLIEGGTNAQYSRTGHILYVDQSGTVFARPFDVRLREWTGSAEPVASGVRTGHWGAGAGYHVSDTGVLVWIDGAELGSRRLVTLDRTGTEIRDYGRVSDANLARSRDGTRLLVNTPTGNNIDLWIVDLATGERDRFTFDLNEEESGVWSPEDERIIWGSAQPGGGRIAFVQPAHRSEDRLVAFEHPYHMHVSDWSPDGRYVAFYDFHPTEGNNVYLSDLEDGGRIIPIAATGANETMASFSPDGRWLAYSSDETGRFEVFVVSVPDANRKRQVSGEGGFQPRWDRRQREIFYLTESWPSIRPPMLMARPVQSGTVLGFGPESELFSLPSSAPFAPDVEGLRFHTLVDRRESRAVTIRVLMNWIPNPNSP